MMKFKIIPTSIFLELLVIFLMFQVGFTLLFVVIGILMQDVLSKIPISQIPVLIPYVFPFAQSFCGQLVMVFSCVMTYARIRQSHEIRALQSSGISSWRIMTPAFTLAFIMSLVSFWMADLNCSWGRQGIQQAMLSSLESIIYRTLEAEKGFPISDDYFLAVSGVEDKTLKNLYLTTKDSAKKRLFSAESAELRIGTASQLIHPEETCYTKSGEIYKPNKPKEVVVKLSVEKPDFQIEQKQISSNFRYTIVIPLDELNSFTQQQSNSASQKSLSELNEYIESCLQNIQEIKQEMALQSVNNILEGNFENFSSESWKYQYLDSIKDNENRIRRAKIEPTRRLAFAFNCLFLTWVCAPIALKRGEMGTLILICTAILPLLFTYYPLMMVALQIVKETTCSPLLLWIPNLCLFVLGFVLVRRAL